MRDHTDHHDAELLLRLYDLRREARLRQAREWFIGQFQADGSIKVVESSQEPLAPVVYPDTRTPEEWKEFLQGWYERWGKRWSAPAESG